MLATNPFVLVPGVNHDLGKHAHQEKLDVLPGHYFEFSQFVPKFEKLLQVKGELELAVKIGLEELGYRRLSMGKAPLGALVSEFHVSGQVLVSLHLDAP